MTQKTFSLIAGVIFTLVALVHLCRLAEGWDIVLGSWAAPMWVSWVGLIIPGILGYFGFKFGVGK